MIKCGKNVAAIGLSWREALRYTFVMGPYSGGRVAVVDDATAEIVHRASRIYTVLTPDLPALTLARHRCSQLVEQGINSERISLVVNRWREGGLKPSDVEDFVERPVAALLVDDHQSAYRATVESQLAAPETPLGRSFSAFARHMAGLPPRPEEPASASPLGFLKKLRAKASV